VVSVSVRWVYLAVVVATTIWVGFDASTLGVKRGRLGGGVVDMSVTSWVICCFFLWIISFPCYLVARSKYQALSRGGVSYPGRVGLPPQQQSYRAAPTAVPFSAYVPPAPPQVSPDGRWWWDGQRWVAMAPPVAQGGSGQL